MSEPNNTAMLGSGSIQMTYAAQLSSAYSRIKDYLSTVRAKRKPWHELIDRNAISKPATLGEATTRIRKNVNYFKLNYIIIILNTTVLSFLMHPSSLIVLLLLSASWAYVFLVRQGPLVINGKTLSEREKLLSMSALTFIMIFFVTSIGTVFFSAISLSIALVVVHGALREPDNLFLDDSDSQGSAFSLFPSSFPTPSLASNV
uniref:PRA1 family protein n=1 Tax=Polytomella parva TaxID=51329 RepID=A0A7S0VS06_9CHLO|mmetsp:Transcript_7374/g.14522  ORF Transcript_7374/g.14522 Transcript_7374/m.14522 type:complete len:203 (+) Transcript_7374:79-687(+)